MATAVEAYTSFDHMSAGQVALLPFITGSVASIVTPGLDGVGQAVNAPSTLAVTYAGSTYDTATVVFRYKPTAITTTRDIVAIRVGSSPHLRLKHDASGNLSVQQGTVGTTWNSTRPPIVASTVYLFECLFYIHDATGAFRIRINGSTDTSLDQASVDTKNDPTVPNRIVFDNPDGHYDDIIVRVGNSGYTTADEMTDATLNPRMRTLFPTGVGQYQEWDPFTDNEAASGDHYTFIDETQLDSTAVDPSTGTVLETKTIDEKESWIYGDLPSDADSVVEIATVYATGNRVGGEQVRHFMRVGAVDYEHTGTPETLGTTFDFEWRRWDENPQSGSAWTPTEVNGSQAGALRETGSNTDEVAISQAVVVAIYRTAAAATEGGNATSLLTAVTHHFASIWEIQREDDQILRFTDHNAPLTFESQPFSPAGGGEASAHRAEAGLKEPNVEIVGILTSDKITQTDLRQGRYRNAKVIERLVDWRFPWAGVLRTYVYWVQDTRWNGRIWTVNLSGVAHRLRNPVGDVYTRNCRYDLGGARCKVILFGYTYFGVSITTVTDKRYFQADTNDIPVGLGNGYFNFGKIAWLAGANAGLTSEIRDYISATRQFELELSAPSTITTSDTFNVEPGCNKLFNGDCFTKYNNRINFGGFLYMPGTDRLVEYPDIKSSF